MYCSNCHAELLEGSVRCPNCNAAIAGDASIVEVFPFAASHRKLLRYKQATLILLGIGALCALLLPAAGFDYQDGNGVKTISLFKLGGSNAGFGVVFACVGIGIAVYGITQLANGSTKWLVRISVGLLLTLALPFEVQQSIRARTSELTLMGTYPLGYLGPGPILASIAFVIAALLPWIGTYRSRRGR